MNIPQTSYYQKDLRSRTSNAATLSSMALAALSPSEDVDLPYWTLEKETIMPNIRRIVQVIIADTNENVPLASCILHKGNEKLTDLTDQELFFELPVADMLAKHNTERVKWMDKEATKRAGKEIYMEPVKVRDLKMLVVLVAQF